MNEVNKTLETDNLYSDNIVDVQKIVSLNKFIFLSIVSFGTYGIWWKYKAWKFFKEKDNLDISPIARTIFSLFYLHSLLEEIQQFAEENGYEKSYSSTALFIGFIIVNFMSKLPDPYWLLSILSFVFLIPAVSALNYAKKNSPDFLTIEETSFNLRQIVLTIFGIIFWGLVLFGLSTN